MLSDRDVLVLEMRAAGATFQAIAYALGVTTRDAGRQAYLRAVKHRAQVPFIPLSAEGRLLGPEDPYFVAWAAGFFDGEGCIHAGFDSGARSGTQAHLMVVVSQTTPEPLLALQRHWGGNLRDHRAPKEGWQHQWHWRLHGRAAGPFLRDVLPYLRVKHEHAEMALQFIDRLKPHGQRVTEEEHAARLPFVLAIRDLNARRHTSRGSRKGRVA